MLPRSRALFEAAYLAAFRAVGRGSLRSSSQFAFLDVEMGLSPRCGAHDPREVQSIAELSLILAGHLGVALECSWGLESWLALGEIASTPGCFWNASEASTVSVRRVHWRELFRSVVVIVFTP